MKIKIIAVGSKMPGWVSQGYNEYAKRLPPELKLELVELPLGPRGKGLDVARAVAREGENMLRHIHPRDHVVALDVKGNPWATEKLAEQLSCWQSSGDGLCLLIGGPDGLATPCLGRANERWSLSTLTLPHPLVRVLLAEQLYRAWTINVGHPYHK